MPPKKSKKVVVYKVPKVKRRKYRLKAGYANSLVLKCLTIGGFPDRYLAKLKCIVTTTPFTFVSTNGTRSIAFKLNSLLTPVGGSGVYTGFQNFLGATTNTGNRQALYINYCIKGIKVKVTSQTNASSTGSINPMMTIAPLPKGQTAGSNTVTAFDWAEQPLTCHRTIAAGSTTDQPNFAKSLKKFWNLHDIYGVRRGSDLHMLDGVIDGTVSADPTDTRYGMVTISTDTANNTDASFSVSPTIELTAYVEFYNRNMQFLS